MMTIDHFPRPRVVLEWMAVAFFAVLILMILAVALALVISVWQMTL